MSTDSSIKQKEKLFTVSVAVHKGGKKGTFKIDNGSLWAIIKGISNKGLSLEEAEHKAIVDAGTLFEALENNGTLDTSNAQKLLLVIK